MRRTDGYAAIRDYAVIGDGRTTALVAKDGSIDWLCLPDVGSPAVFSRLLDSERGGSFRLEPTTAYEVERTYAPGSNVLETTFTTNDGAVRLTDAMTLTDDRRLSPFRELTRKIEGLSGTVGLRWTFEPRFEYGERRRSITRRAGRWFFECGKDAIALGLWDAGEVEAREESVRGKLELAAGQTALLSLSASYQQPVILPGRDDTERRIERTDRFWRDWSDKVEYEGDWREAVLRSALLLKLLVFAPSGAIVAAPTASLPEWIGGGRNWDYRYTWLRDASWTLDAFIRLGLDDEAQAFFWWLMHASRLTQPRLQVLYKVDGSTHTKENDLHNLDGYRGSKPVRVGNGAADQVQLDIYGALLEAIALYVEEVGHLDGETGRDVAKIADYVAKHWRDKDSGIWEVRAITAHFIQSKSLCWVALDRACSLAKGGFIPDHSERWHEAAEEIREFVSEHGWDDERESYVRSTDMRELDASLLTLAILGYEPPESERLKRTVAALERELRTGPFVYRYRGEDGVGGKEGAFLTCSFWLADAFARQGRLDDARSLMEELIGVANDVGLYSEEIDPESGAFLGNFPQGLTHLALINAAVSIRGAEQARGRG